MHSEPHTERHTEVRPEGWTGDGRFATSLLVDGATQLLVTGALGPFDEHGAVLHELDAVAQVALSVQNLERVLDAAGMDATHLLRLELATTDLPAVREQLDLVAERLGAAGSHPALCLTEVARLPQPGALLNLHAVAAR